MTLAGDPTPTPRTDRRASSRVLALYDGAAQTRRTSGWRAPTSSANAAILAGLTLLRDRSRAATRNNGYANGAIGDLVSNVVGTGIKPLSMAADKTLRKRINEAWLRWTDESDADGMLDLYGQMGQAVRGAFEAGESYTRMRPRRPEDGLSVPLQLQVIEPELCPHTLNKQLPNGNKVKAGIEFNAIGKRVAFHFYQSRPGDLEDYDSGSTVRIPAEAVIHLYNPLRAGQLRGTPILTQALIRLNELDKFDDATLLRQQLANMFVAFVTRPTQTGTEPAIQPLTGEEIDAATDKPMLSLEPGLFQELSPGEDVEFSDPPDVGNSYEAFMRQNLYASAKAIGLPYEVLSGDMSRVNDRTVRVVLNEFRRRIQAWQHQIVVFQWCRRVWRAWMDRAFLVDAIGLPIEYATNPEPFLRCKWMPQRWQYLNPVQDVQAMREEIRAGFTSRSATVSELGEDAESIDNEQAEDNRRADDLELVYSSDGRVNDSDPTPPGSNPDDDTVPANRPANEGNA